MSVTDFEGERTLVEANLTCVADERRREILAALRGRDGPVDRRELAAQVAAAERDVAPGDVPEQEVDSVLLTLHHNHLPKLEDEGLLAYDHHRNRITPELTGERAEAALAAL